MQLPTAITALLLFLLLAGCSSQPAAPPDATQANNVAFTAMNQVGKPYRYGGNTPDAGFDCSGLIGYVYRDSERIALPRTVAAISDDASPEVTDPADLFTGDIVIFGSSVFATPDHAGIYVGKGRFVHAPSRGGKVRLDSLNNRYWQPRFIKAKRPLSR